MTGGDWADVAAEGTDPDRLARVVRRAAADPRGLAADLRRLTDAGAGVAEAVRDVADEPVLDDQPGNECARRWRAAGARVALAGDPGMPDRLAHVQAPPPWLAMTGGREVTGPSVAMVGSRKASAYGRAMAAWLADAAGRAGVHVVSGGAVGIDAASHEAALATDGATTVVLGCGHDVAYPRAHAQRGGLFDQVLDAGGSVVSEALPGEPPRPWRVRARNRLIAGLADVVVVVEGGARSGSLITASWAADHGQQVLAVPGDARAPGSAAPLQLLRDGAGLCATPDDLFAALDVAVDASGTSSDEAPSTPSRQRLVAVMPEVAADVLVRAWPRAVTMTQLADEAGLPAGRLMAGITAAQVTGLVTRDLEGLRLCRDPGSVSS